MRSLLLIIAVVLSILLLPRPTAAAAPLSQAPCTFTLGFKLLRDQIPVIVGECLEDEHGNVDPVTGQLVNLDTLQQTTGGLLVWRQADNWTAFTNGVSTWINGPFGLASRPNAGPLFEWEAPPPAAAAPPAPAPPAPAPLPPPREPAPQTISGRGQRVSDRFSLEAGLSMFRMQHSGSRNFAIWLLDEGGNRLDLLVNLIGGFSGATAFGIVRGGNHVLDVTADGDWSVTIEQPRPTAGQGIPATFSGTGKQVSPFVSLPSGLKTVQMRHNGRRNFAIWLLDRNGQRLDLLVNTIGGFDGSKAVTASGVTIMDIEADGDWSITVQ